MNRPSHWVLLLAVGTTVAAICLSALAGWQRGGALLERLVWMTIGIVLVLSTHLLPSLVRDSPPLMRWVAAALWVTCLAAACYGHATFFLIAQRHAGEIRAAAVAPGAAPVPAGRSLTVVMTDRASVTRQLALAASLRCARDCAGLEARRATLAARLEALNAEADEVRRRQTADDRATALRDALRDALTTDPVSARLAAFFGTTAARIDLLSSLAFAAILEGVACLLWTVALRPRPPTPRLASVAPSHTPTPVSHAVVTDSHSPASQPGSPLPGVESSDADVTRLMQDVAAGRVRPTVANIRRHFGCSQARATALRRQLAAVSLAA
ncbi:conserved membrane hypothetical protein [Cupriavidus necator]|uniref:Uncharacterized protein n=1 Tax=Cupriavidus necator TaxID=106590 RepID=A0A1K0ISH9_CUPNE|nr:conserved membrane hypothetical protein [Cupriavidus necator]